jgi:hypothetical protein
MAGGDGTLVTQRLLKQFLRAIRTVYIAHFNI